MMLRVQALAILTVLFLFLAGGPAEAQVFAYSVSSEGDDKLYRLDLSTGQENLVGPVGFADVEGLTFHPLTGVLHGVDAATGTLLNIDRLTGAGTAVGAGAGNLGVTVAGLGLAFDQMGNLWMSAGSSQTLYAVDPLSGAASAVGPMGQSVTGLAAFGTTLYGLGGDGANNLVMINTSTGAAAPVGALVNLTTMSGGGIAFAPDDTLWTVTDPPGETGTIDKATGVATLVEKVPSGRFESLAFAQPTSAVCGAAPRNDCRSPVAAGRAAFELSVKGSKHGWRWRWSNGAATTTDEFGHPETGTPYSLCVYDHVSDTPVLVMSAFAPPGGNWAGKKGRFDYKDKTPAAGGITRVSLRPGVGGRADIRAEARGNGLSMPPMPLSEDSQVTVQLLALQGPCWEASYASPAKANSASRYSGRGE
ncbi:MAG: hypothetical protein Q8R92_10950 [Deltaproteobacteria bacterium]|nr:hypothetical protein [Deltaproteobacteria bacterium]